MFIVGIKIYSPMGLNNGPQLLLWTGGIGCRYEPHEQSGGDHRSRSDSTETRNTLILDFSSGGSHHRFIPASRESKSVPCPHFTQEIRSHPIRREREREICLPSQALLRSAAASPPVSILGTSLSLQADHLLDISVFSSFLYLYLFSPCQGSCSCLSSMRMFGSFPICGSS